MDIAKMRDEQDLGGQIANQCAKRHVQVPVRCFGQFRGAEIKPMGLRHAQTRMGGCGLAADLGNLIFGKMRRAAPRDDADMHLTARIGHPRDGTARAQHLVIRMGGDHQRRAGP